MYVITDSYGTRRRAWTLANALDWLAHCSPDAQINYAVTGKLVARRHQVRVY